MGDPSLLLSRLRSGMSGNRSFGVVEIHKEGNRGNSGESASLQHQEAKPKTFDNGGLSPLGNFSSDLATTLDSTTENNTSVPDGETVLRVCCGSDCAGVCSGAALLEMEELCQEVSFPARLARTRCLGMCKIIGPNVKIAGKLTKSAGNGEVFSKVDSAERCAQVISSAMTLAGFDNAEAASAILSKAHVGKGAMVRRAEGLRWEALDLVYKESMKRCADAAYIANNNNNNNADLSSDQADVGQRGSPPGKGKGKIEEIAGIHKGVFDLEESAWNRLEKALAAERAAAASEEERMRAERRAERLRVLVKGLDTRIWD